MSASASNPAEAGPEERAHRAEVALTESLAERNRLWEELSLERARERELADLRLRLATIERSAWWRAGAPLRLAGRAARDPVLAVKVLHGYLRSRRKRLGR